MVLPSDIPAVPSPRDHVVASIGDDASSLIVPGLAILTLGILVIRSDYFARTHMKRDAVDRFDRTIGFFEVGYRYHRHCFRCRDSTIV